MGRGLLRLRPLLVHEEVVDRLAVEALVVNILIDILHGLPELELLGPHRGKRQEAEGPRRLDLPGDLPLRLGADAGLKIVSVRVEQQGELTSVRKNSPCSF